MKKTLLFLLLNLMALMVVGQNKKIAPGNTIGFVIKNAGLKVDGTFSGLQGTIVFDPSYLENAVFDVRIDAKTVSTGTAARDGHLKKKEYFDVDTYPNIGFKSKKIEATKTGFVATGILSLKGKTKEIKIPFSYSEKNTEGVFTGSFVVNRLDFGVGESSWILADEATILLTIKVLNL